MDVFVSTGNFFYKVLKDGHYIDNKEWSKDQAESICIQLRRQYAGIKVSILEIEETKLEQTEKE